MALALAPAARAVLDLPPCQSRCYTMTAGLVGCGAEDYACHCAAFDARFAPQMSSCMIEGCAFDNETPLSTSYLCPSGPRLSLALPSLQSGFAATDPGCFRGVQYIPDNAGAL